MDVFEKPAAPKNPARKIRLYDNLSDVSALTFIPLVIATRELEFLALEFFLTMGVSAILKKYATVLRQSYDDAKLEYERRLNLYFTDKTQKEYDRMHPRLDAFFP